MAMAARLPRRTLQASEVASRLLSASNGLVQRAAYATGGIVDVGQPTPLSHPELLADGEITPGITSEEYISRRKRLLEVLPEKSLAIFASADQQMMTDVVPYPFRQSGDYLYITGCTQPGGVAVLSEASGLCMFMPDTNKEDIVWQGQTAGVEAAVDFFKADKAFPLSQLQKTLPEMIERSKMVYHNVKTSSSYENLDAFHRASLNKKVKDIAHYTDELRWVKSKSEVKLMRESASIVSQSLVQTMLLSRTHREESQLAAKIEYECKMRGAQRMAFHPVVGGGANGSVIHYSRNDRKIKTGDLLLMDVGCEYHGYLSDLTRTWPPCGRFSPAQEELYSLILETNKECIKLCKPGASINEIHNHSVKMLVKGFQELGIVEKGKSMQYNYLNPTAIGLAPPLDLLLNAGIVDALTDGDRPRRTLTLTVCVPDPRSLVRHGYSRLHDTHEGQTLGAGRCHNDRARGLYPSGADPEGERAGEVPRHGRPHRGRGPRHRDRPRGADGVGAQGDLPPHHADEHRRRRPGAACSCRW